MKSDDVIFMQFPYSDLSGAKLRPAVVLALIDRHDFIACQVTSQQQAARSRVRLASTDFVRGGLPLESFALPAKLFTGHTSIVAKRVGRVSTAVLTSIRDETIKLLR